MPTRRAFLWSQLTPHCRSPLRHPQPLPRDVWGGMLAFRDRLLVFGGATLMYGPAERTGDLTTLGTLNDLWEYDPVRKQWTEVQAHIDDGSIDRPRGRVLPAWVADGDICYLFGGLAVKSPGWHTLILDDLWSYTPGTGTWRLLEAHDGCPLENDEQPPGTRPTTVCAAGAVCVDGGLYILTGWGGVGADVVMSSQLWRYEHGTGTWQFLGSRASSDGPWPAKRYCAATCAWEGSIYLWGGRDTQDRAPQFYNDLWVYDVPGERWQCKQPHDPRDQSRPSPRYGMGHCRAGDYLYVFGGFGSETGNAPQLNDLWQYNLRTGKWDCLFEHDGAKDYSVSATRPGVRRVPGMAAIGENIYLFAGIDLASGVKNDGPTVGFNELWCGRRCGL